MTSEKIQNVPVSIITGFLGVGKTSSILNFLKNKPENERWAVLVNEFGEIGIDGGLLAGQQSVEEGVFIREVPGGCMCCTAGLPMRTALNQLLKYSRPDRLLIEPTGLGHPAEVVATLTGPDFQNVLSLTKIITLVDARNLSDSRYIEHGVFNQQIAIADIIIGNKHDCYQQDDEQTLKDYAVKVGKSHAQIYFSRHGKIPAALLDSDSGTDSSAHSVKKHGHRHKHDHSYTDSYEEITMEEIPSCGFIRAENQGEGYSSVGWRFSGEVVFDRTKLLRLFSMLGPARMKAVIKTADGVFGYNFSSGEVTEVELSECKESRVEIIAERIDVSIEDRILQCRL